MQRASPVTAAPRPPGVWAQLPLLCILVQGEGEAPALLCRHASGRVGAGSCPTGISMSGRGDPSRGTSRQRGGLPMLSSSPRRRGVAGMRSRQRMFAAVMRLLLKCLRLGRRRRFKLVRQAEQLWHYGHLCLRSLLYNSFTNSDVVLDSLFEPVYWLVDHVTRWFGVVFVALVIGLTSSIVAIVYICLLPLILQTYTPAWICWHLAYGHWNLIMIVFHYYMAITTSPGHPPQEMHCPQASSHPPLQHLQQVRAEDGPPLPLAKQLRGTLQPPLLLLLLPLHDHGLHLLQHQWLGDVPGRLRSHRDVLPDPATHLLLPPASFPQERGLPLGPVQLGGIGPGCPHAVACRPHHPWGNQHRAAHQQEGEAEAAEERFSGTPTVTAAGITGRCSWAWTCQGTGSPASCCPLLTCPMEQD
ncbi:palmitoyltransferase ZDHHC16 isoform X5 [Nyctibius grandis]|uniref:palmitoyltransferase ZDHHC16 isoform X5 n=1 Tax=Nyctibius grandis TaxID=48427 RepID=UPI0035BBD2B3